MARLLAVNVGLPRDIEWQGRTVVSGAVVYGPEPLDEPAEGNVLVCCSQPTGDVVVDL